MCCTRSSAPATIGAGTHEPTLQEQLPRIAADDLEAIQRVPWLGLLTESQFLSQSVTSELLQQWRSTGIELSDVRARVITAEHFNSICGSGSNKADLLSESTLGLVRKLSDLHGTDEPNVAVFCDRHGGRSFTAACCSTCFPMLDCMSSAKRSSKADTD